MEGDLFEYMESKRKCLVGLMEQDITKSEYGVITEADVESTAKNANTQVAIKITMLDQLKVKRSKDNQLFLDTYEEKAKSNNPIGLVIDNLETADINKFKAVSDQVFAMIDKKEKEALRIDDIPTIKSWIQDNIYKDGIYNEIFNILYHDKRPNITMYIKTEKKHNVSKSDVIRAITVLKSDEYSKIEADLRSQLKYFEAQLSTHVDAGVKSGRLNIELDDYYNTVKVNMISLRKLAVNHILDTRSRLTKLDIRSSREIVRKAALYNPKSYKESMMFIDELDSEE